MSVPLLAAGDFDDWDDNLKFEAIAEHFDDPKPYRRPARTCAEREAINEALGIRRHRSNEKEM